MSQFKRNYKLRINDRAGGLLFTIADLRIEFDITKNIDNRSKTNVAVLKVYNLSNETLGKISNTQMACQVLLDVGYDGELTRLLTSDIIQLSTVKRKGEVVTTFECAEGFMLANETKISKTYPENAKVVDVLDDLLSTNNVTNRDICLADSTATFPFGYYAIGTLKQVLDDITYPIQHEWNMDGEKVVIKPKRALTTEAANQVNDKSETIFVLSEQSGLIGIPSTHDEAITQAYDESAPNELNENEFDVSDPLKPSKSGKPRKQTRQRVKRFNVKCQCLLNPSIIPNGLVKIVSVFAPELNGLYRVRTVRYNGDSRGNDWYCDLYIDNVEGIR